jgi:kynurenine--oxoglutarate transaminase/cysteine-S-conjugate beta-lyase/glutamine--phenylpyruvate transaminase
VGASQALYLTLQAHVNPGDEVLLLEPAFDLYYGQVRLAGGKVSPVALAVDEEAGRWRLDVAALERACTDKTKLLVFNSPHNPTGTAFTADEMEAIAAVVRKHPNLMVISDEVYKYTVYAEDAAHTHFAALPGMYDRTVTLSSAGKTFSITGWQAGWCIGPERLIKPIQLLLPFVQFCVSTPVQNALSRVLTLADGPYEGHASYYDWLRAMYRRKREVLARGLRAAGMGVMEGQGGFFLMADTSGIAVPQRYLDETTPAAPNGVTRDWAFCRWMALEGGVIAIPASPFYSAPNKALAANYIRFAFCKGDDTLEEACARIQKLVGGE